MFLDDDQENLLERIESSSRLMQGLFGSSNLNRKDLMILESLIFDMVDGKISAEQIIDKELIKRIKGNWLYRGFTLSKDTEAKLNYL